MRPQFWRSSSGISQILHSQEVARAVRSAADRVAAQVSAQVGPDVDVVVDDYVTDRAASSVTIRDAQGRLWQVRDGVLTRAAASAGLEVASR